MIRQHFYPKTYFRHRSLSKSNYKINQFLQQNANNNQQKITDVKKPQDSNRTKFKRKSSINMTHHDKTLQNQKNQFSISIIATQIKNRNKNQPETHYPLKKILKSQQCYDDFIQNQHQQLAIHNTNILKQNQNRSNVEISHRNYCKQMDFDNLFIKSQKKEIVITNRNSYRVLNPKYNVENDSFCIQQTIKNMVPYSKTYRKLSSADASKSTLRRSIDKKRKSCIIPQQMIISSNLKTLQKTLPLQTQKKQLQFQKMSNNLINLNLSKAIKFRKSSKHEKVRNCKSKKISYNLEDIQNRNVELEQKVKGWEINIQEDVDF